MKYSFLGETDIKVSNYCLGTMTFGEQTNEVDSHLQMDKAFDAGTSYPWYVHMLDNGWRVEYFQTDQLEVISECG